MIRYRRLSVRWGTWMLSTRSPPGDGTDPTSPGLLWRRTLPRLPSLEHPTQPGSFTRECSVSALAKANYYVVSMAPPESYLDATRSAFSRPVGLAYPEPYPEAWHREFT